LQPGAELPIFSQLKYVSPARQQQLTLFIVTLARQSVLIYNELEALANNNPEKLKSSITKQRSKRLNI